MPTERTTDRRDLLKAGAGVAASLGTAGCVSFIRQLAGVGGSGAAGAPSISYGETHQGSIEEGDGTDPKYGDLADPVQFEGQAGDAVTITMEAPGISAYLVLEGPSGSAVAEHERGLGPTSIIDLTLPETGTYVIWVGSTSGTATGSYTLTLEKGGGGDTGGNGGSGSQDLDSISYGETKEGSIDQGDGSDPKYGDLAEPVEFEGQAGDTVTITMEAPGISAYLVLEGPSGSAIAEHQEGLGSTSIITTTLPASGTYTIWVGSTSGTATGSYTLTLEKQ